MCSIYRVQSRESLSILLYSVTCYTILYLKCSGGDYISHHNTNADKKIEMKHRTENLLTLN